MKKELMDRIGLTEEQVEAEVNAALEGLSAEELDSLYESSINKLEEGSIVKGEVLEVRGNSVVVDLGGKAEGLVPIEQFSDPAELVPGTKIDVYVEVPETRSGVAIVSKERASRLLGWERVVSECKEGDVVKGRVIRKIKGGLLVDIGVPVFLPSSHVSDRKVEDIGEFVGKEIEAKILKIDIPRRNIVISRKALLEEEKAEKKRKVLESIEEGQLVRGVVKNITDFGAFIDLGGIDGLLHVTDMSWGRVSHPSEMVAPEQEIEVVVLKVDKENEKIALGLKQKTPNPWDNIEEKYPVGSRVKGKVVSVVPYGAFVQLEEGVEGLVHVSEMSWTRRVNHPSEVVSVGETVEVMVLGIDHQKQEISLGMKQLEKNPWDVVDEKYPPGTIIKGRVRNVTSYGAFVELEEGIEGLLHVNDMSWTKKINHASEVVKKGDRVEVVVLSVDKARKRISLGMKQLHEDPWMEEIPSKYKAGDIVKGKVTKITNFGAFVEIEPELEGLVHISEMSDHRVNDVREVVKEGDEVEAVVVSVDPQERKIGLSLKDVSSLKGTATSEEEVASDIGETTEESSTSEEDGSSDTTSAAEVQGEGEGEEPDSSAG